MRVPDLLDRSMKVLIREAPPVFFRLPGVELDPAQIRREDVTINLPEHRADQVFLIGAEDDPKRWAAHLEYQLQPKPDALRGWFLKNAALTKQLDLPVILIALYLEKGRRATFPAEYAVRAGKLGNSFAFETVRLWEHADRIRSGELAELAPLLALCEDQPTEETLRTERELILGLDVGRELKADLLGVAITVGARRFPREMLLDLFREELPMLKEIGLVEEWILEGEARGEARGEERARRDMVLLLLRERFGELPESVEARVRTADAAWCEDLARRILHAGSLEELGF